MSSPRHWEREFEILTAEVGLRAFERDGAEQSPFRHERGTLFRRNSQHSVLAMQENLYSLFELSTV